METTATRVYPALNPSGVLLVFADRESQTLACSQAGWCQLDSTVLATAGQYSTEYGIEIVIEPA